MKVLLLCLLPALVSSLTPVTALVDAGAALVLGAGPGLVPQLKQGYENMAAKYADPPKKDLFDTSAYAGVFPEYDNTGAPLSVTHVLATVVASTFLFFGAIEQARFLFDTGATDFNDVYAMALYAFSFQGDSLTHAALSKNSADGNIMQRGHLLDTAPMIAFFLYANYLDGGAWYALTDLPSDHYWMFLPRLFSSPLFLFVTFYSWQPLHGAGFWLNDKKD